MTIEAHANGKVSHNLDTVFKELAALRAENRRLKDKLSTKARGSKIVRRALVDAHTITMAAFSGENTGRVAMQEGGMTKHRWAWGVAFLRYAGVVSFSNGGVRGWSLLLPIWLRPYGSWKQQQKNLQGPMAIDGCAVWCARSKPSAPIAVPMGVPVAIPKRVPFRVPLLYLRFPQTGIYTEKSQ